jgi:hypothetical protein
MRTITLKDILHDREIKQAIALYKRVQPHKLNAALVDKLIAPNLDRINRDLGQDNDARYLAYCVEYCLMHMNIARKPSLVDKRGGDYADQTEARSGQVTESGWSLRGNYTKKRQPARHVKEW